MSHTSKLEGVAPRYLCLGGISHWAFSFSWASLCPQLIFLRHGLDLSPYFILFYFIFGKFIYFNWRLITLQYWSGFCHISHESTMGVRVSPILNPSPTSLPIPSLRVVPVHQPWAPCLMHQTWLVIYFTYGNIHVSMLISQIIPPSSSPTESKSLFFTSVSLLLSRI